MGKKLNLFIPITKVEQHDDHVMVYGVAALEQPDRSVPQEIMDYGKSKPYFQSWSDQIFKDSGGKSLGNVREMHSLIAAGKLEELHFNDGDKQIEVAAKVVDPGSCNKLNEGILTGFSVGGQYGDRWQDGDLVRYVAKPAEISLVDSPCMPGATYSLVRADGAVEERHFTKPPQAQLELIPNSGEESHMPVTKTKKVGDQELPSSSFAYVGDAQKTETWRFPLHKAEHVRQAIAHWGEYEGIPQDQQESIKKAIIAAARKFAIKPREEAKKILATTQLMKSYWNISDLAQMLATLDRVREAEAWEREYEGDSSPVPEELAAIEAQLDAIMKEMIDEETKEREEKVEPVNKNQPTDLEKAAAVLAKAKDVLSHLKKAAAASKSHHEAMMGHLQECAKAAGSEETIASSEPTPVSTTSATPNELTLAVQTAAQTAATEAVKLVLGELKKGFETPPAQDPTVAARPVLKVHIGNEPPPAKPTDSNNPPPAGDFTGVDFTKVAAGDPQELAKAAHFVRPSPMPDGVLGHFTRT